MLHFRFFLFAYILLYLFKSKFLYLLSGTMNNSSFMYVTKVNIHLSNLCNILNRRKLAIYPWIGNGRISKTYGDQDDNFDT